MPCDYKKYPPNWKTEVRPSILERANNCCEECGVKNKAVGYRDKDGKFYDSETILNLLEESGYDIFCNELSHIAGDTKPIKIVLTISHTDHDTTNNNYSNLKALCQLHHLRHDIGHHKQSRKKKRGLQELF